MPKPNRPEDRLPANADGEDPESAVRPSFNVYQQLPAITWKPDWTKREIDNALAQHELGNFQMSAMLADAMTRDDTFDAVLTTRVDGLLGLDREIDIAQRGDKRGNKRIARDIFGRFEEFFPRAAISTLKRWEILMGFAIAQIVWKPNEDATEWVPSIEPWHPMYTYVRIDTMTYYALTAQGPVEVKPGTGQWLLYTPRGERYGWMSGAVRSISIPWLARQYGWRDWLRWSELYSLGIRKAKVPAKAKESVKRKFYNQVAALGSATTVLLEQMAKDDPSFDVEVLFPDASNAADGYERLLNKCEAKIAIRINGQNLTTEVKGGSFAAAKVHENVKQDILQSDSATLGECLGRDVVKPFVQFHDYPERTEQPIIGWHTAPPEDAKANADTVAQVGVALTSFQTAQAPVDVRRLLERFDIPVLPEGEASQLAPPAAPPGNDNGAPGDKPAGTAPGEDDPQANEPDPGEGDEQPAAAASRRIRASRSVTTMRGSAKGQRYVDALTDRARHLAGASLKGDVDAILQACEAGESFEDVRRRIVKVYRERPVPRQLAEIMHTTNVLADAAGRAGAHEDHTS